MNDLVLLVCRVKCKKGKSNEGKTRNSNDVMIVLGREVSR